MTNPTDIKPGKQSTGNLRWLVEKDTQPRLQQEVIDRHTEELEWITIPFVHSNEDEEE